ncbi:hypothetical protein C8Q72DRAFT_879876 [Fomitopsis betulina]|nr:hypothetical protein C8Q72DRAFT_879876 [Fomitopsis betulina]
MGAEATALPMEEKMKFEQGDDGVSFGYKAAGANATRETGILDPHAAEFINVPEDDALAWPEQVYHAYPPPVSAHMASHLSRNRYHTPRGFDHETRTLRRYTARIA